MTAEKSSLPFEAGSISFPSYYRVYFCLQRFFLAGACLLLFLTATVQGHFYYELCNIISQ